MIIISKSVKKDIRKIIKGLQSWKVYKISKNEAIDYALKIKHNIYKIDNLFFHEKAKYDTHKLYGEYIHTYKANAHTQWYIIYDISPNGDIWINKIINNHMTVSGISGLPGTRNNNILKTLLIAAGFYALYKITSK